MNKPLTQLELILLKSKFSGKKQPMTISKDYLHRYFMKLKSTTNENNRKLIYLTDYNKSYIDAINIIFDGTAISKALVSFFNSEFNELGYKLSPEVNEALPISLVSVDGVIVKNPKHVLIRKHNLKERAENINSYFSYGLTGLKYMHVVGLKNYPEVEQLDDNEREQILYNLFGLYNLKTKYKDYKWIDTAIEMYTKMISTLVKSDETLNKRLKQISKNIAYRLSSSIAVLNREVSAHNNMQYLLNEVVEERNKPLKGINVSSKNIAVKIENILEKDIKFDLGGIYDN